MNDVRIAGLKDENRRLKEAMDMIYCALLADNQVPFPTKALSREVLNDALIVAGYAPVEDRQVMII